MRRITELPNKIRIVTKAFPDRASAAIGIWIAAGGRHENAANKGVAHFFEHMAFKGSAQYSCDQIKQLIEGVGGNINAFTSEEETCFYAKVPAENLKQTFDVLADISFFPKIAAKDVDKERTVILEEIKMYHDQPQSYVIELLDELLWPDHPLGQNLAGTMKSVGEMSSAQVRDFQKTYYIPANTVISACGPFKHEDVVAMVRSKLGKLSGAESPKFIAARKTQDAPTSNLFHKNTEQMHLALGYLGYETNHKDYYVLALMSIILGGNMSSRLFNEVREKRGLAYSIGSGIKSLQDTGLFMVRAGVDNAKIVDAMTLILRVLGQMTKTVVPHEEFKRAQEYYMGQFLLGLEDTMDQMLWTGAGVISGDKVTSIADVVKKIKAVNPSDVRRVAAQVLAPQRLNLAIVGPLTEAQNRQLGSLASVA